MASPTPEEVARDILSVFLSFNRRAGGVLMKGNFAHDFYPESWEDFLLGMEYAAQEKWVEVLPDEISFKLTDKGFAEAQR